MEASGFTVGQTAYSVNLSSVDMFVQVQVTKIGKKFIYVKTQNGAKSKEEKYWGNPVGNENYLIIAEPDVGKYLFSKEEDAVEFIERKELIKNIRRIICNCKAGDFTIGQLRNVKDILTNHADFAPVRRGEWMPVDDDTFDCSECNAMVSKEYNYCPCCGADMRGCDY